MQFYNSRYNRPVIERKLFGHKCRIFDDRKLKIRTYCSLGRWTAGIKGGIDTQREWTNDVVEWCKRS